MTLMNVNHPTSASIMRKRIVPKHLTHISVLVWMVILEMELTVKVKTDVLYQTLEKDSVCHISRQPGRLRDLEIQECEAEYF